MERLAGFAATTSCSRSTTYLMKDINPPKCVSVVGEATRPRGVWLCVMNYDNRPLIPIDLIHRIYFSAAHLGFVAPSAPIGAGGGE